VDKCLFLNNCLLATVKDQVELIRLLERYGYDSYKTNMLSRELQKAFRSIPDEAVIQVSSIASEVGLEIFEARFVKAAISLRKSKPEARGTLVYLNEGYIKDSQYNNLVREVVHQLKEDNKANLHMIPRGKIRWDYLPSYLLKNYFDFCCDPYFKTGPRSHLVNVVQFGWVESFTCVIYGESEFLGGKLTDPTLSFQERIIGSFESFAGLEVGGLGETAATMELLEALHNFAEYSDKFFALTSVEQLRYFLSEFPEKRIVICDYGIAINIKRVLKDALERANFPILPGFDRAYISGPGRKDLMFEFSKPVAAGFIYPLHDAEWCEEITKAFGNVIMKNWDEIHWRDIRRELKGVGITAFKEEVLCKRLGLEGFYLEQKKLEKSIESEDYEEAAKARDKIKKFQETASR